MDHAGPAIVPRRLTRQQNAVSRPVLSGCASFARGLPMGTASSVSVQRQCWQALPKCLVPSWSATPRPSLSPNAGVVGEDHLAARSESVSDSGVVVLLRDSHR